MQKQGITAGYSARSRYSRRLARERRQNLLFYAGMLCVCVVTLLENLCISFRFIVQDNYTRPAVAAGLVCVFLLMNDKEVFRRLRAKHYMNIWIFWALFCGLMIYSSFVNQSVVKENNPITKGLVIQLMMLEAICLIQYALVMERTRDVVDFVLKCMGVLIVVSDMLMFGGIRFTDGAFETYLVGSKFDVVYMHLNFASLLLTRMKLSRRKGREAPIPGEMLLVFMAIIVLIALRVDCNTGIIGALLLFGMIYACDRWPGIMAKPLSSPRVFVLALLASTLFAYYVSWLLNIPVITHLIVDKMGRSLTLTGRTNIYAQFPALMRNNWAWGFGYGGAYRICWQYLHYADVQNAMLQWVLQVGVPATAALVLMYAYIMMLYRKKDSLTSAAPMLMLVYMYILLGTVEITMNNNFCLWMLLLFMFACADPKKINDELPKPSYTPRTTRRRRNLID